VIHDCGCWRIRGYGVNRSLILCSFRCWKHSEEVLDFLEHQLYLDKVDSVSGPEEEEAQLWLT